MKRTVLFFTCVTIFIALSHPQQLVSADILTNSIQQRIGDYDIQINTVPSVPISGHETRINIRIGAVSNIPITDTLIVMKISDEKKELVRTQPVLLSTGHYSYEYIFSKPGTYLLSVEIPDSNSIRDLSNSSKNLTFDFPIQISEPFLAQLNSLLVPIMALVAVIGSIIIIALFKKSKNGNKII